MFYGFLSPLTQAAPSLLSLSIHCFNSVSPNLSFFCSIPPSLPSSLGGRKLFIIHSGSRESSSGRLVHHRNIEVIEWIAIKIGADVHGVWRIRAAAFTDALNFNLVLPAGIPLKVSAYTCIMRKLAVSFKGMSTFSDFTSLSLKVLIHIIPESFCRSDTSDTTTA